MTEKGVISTTLRRAESGLPLYFNLAIVIAFFSGSAILAYFNIRTLRGKRSAGVSHL